VDVLEQLHRCQDRFGHLPGTALKLAKGPFAKPVSSSALGCEAVVMQSLHSDASTPVPKTPEPRKASLAGDRAPPAPVDLPVPSEPLGAMTVQNNRAYRQTHNPVDNPAYTGRNSTFASVWGEIDLALRTNPRLSVQQILGELQQRYPGRFHDGQIGFFRRCVADWRGEHPAYAKPSKTKPRNMERAAALLDQAYIDEVAR